MKKLLILAVVLACASLAQAQALKGADAYAASYAAEAKADYKTAIGDIASAKDASPYTWLIRMGWLTYLQGELTQSAEFYQQAIKLEPKSVDARLGYAYPIAALKQWDKLEALYKDLLKISPGNYTALYRLGLLSYNLGNYDKALPHLIELRTQYPLDHSGRVLLAWTYLKLGKYDDARTQFQTSLLIKPGDTSALEGLKLVTK